MPGIDFSKPNHQKSVTIEDRYKNAPIGGESKKKELASTISGGVVFSFVIIDLHFSLGISASITNLIASTVRYVMLPPFLPIWLQIPLIGFYLFLLQQATLINTSWRDPLMSANTPLLQETDKPIKLDMRHNAVRPTDSAVQSTDA